MHHIPLLSATLCPDDLEPRFRIGADENLDFRFYDARGEADPTAAADARLAGFFEEPVDTPLIRYMLIWTDEADSIVAIKSSHLVLDGMGILFHIAFLGTLYTALVRGEVPSQGEICSASQPYREDQAHRASAQFERDMAFWADHLRQSPEKRIFRARPGCADVLGHSRHKKYVLSDETSSAIASLIAARRISPAVFFTAVHVLIVGFMCDEAEIAVQTPIAFGERKAADRRQGMCVALPSQFVDLRQHPTFASLTQEIAAQCASFFRHVRTPFQLAMRRFENKDFSFLADTFINYLPNVPAGTPEFPIWDCSQQHSDQEPVLFGGMVLQDPRTRQFSLTMRSSRNHLSEQDVDRYVKRVDLVSRQLAAGIELSQLDFLLDEEKRELGLWGRGPERPYAIRPLPDLFDEKAELFADRNAVRDEIGTALTYAEVRRNSIRCATWLTAQGVKKGDIVAVLARRSIALPEIVLGIQRCGAVYLPIDPSAPSERVSFIVADAGADLVMDPDDLSYRDACGPECAARLSPQDGAYLIYTSGSTGRPKGVLAPHGGFANMIQGQIDIFGVGQDDRVLQFAPPIFDASLSEMFMALFAGACLYPVGDATRNAPWTLKRYMEENRVSVVTLPPSYLGLFNQDMFAGLRVLITAGEPPIVADALHYARHLDYFNAYGPTETCVCATIKRVPPDASAPIGVGRPIPNVAVSVRDRAGRVLPAGMVGELWIGGESVALGYHNNPDLTDTRFRAPTDGDARAYASGDLARWSEDGEILLVGRADDQVKIRGNRVELGEVSFLLERCAQVSQATALAVKDTAGQTILAAFLVLRDGATLDSVIAWSRGHLPGYMLPSEWHLLQTMPVTATGKVDRKSLMKTQAIHRAPADPGRSADPRLLDICAQALGRPCDPAVNFFMQGGNSLSAMSFLHDIRKTFGVDVVFRDFAACETLFDVEALLRRNGVERTFEPVAAPPLNRAQFRIWAYQQANAGTVDYNMPLLLEVRGPRAADFWDGLCRAVQAQELLCCTIAGDIDAPRFAAGATISPRIETFSDVSEAGAFFDRESHTPFDLRHEPPVRLIASRLPDRLQVLIVLHHVAGDGETLDILLRSAVGSLRDEPPALGRLAIQAEFCRRETAYLRSEAARADAAYWQAVCASAAASRPVPAMERRGAMCTHLLAPAAIERLETLARRSGATLLAAFVAVLGRFLCRRRGDEDLLIGVPVGLRETQDEFRTAGFFVNTLPLCIQGGEDAVAASRRTAAHLREALVHSRYCDFPAVPDFLATHAVPARIEADGLVVDRVGACLRASKFSGSFTLETGEAPRLVLEYDAVVIPGGEALLADLAEEIAALDLSDADRDPRQILADAWREILGVRAADPVDFFEDGGDSIKAIQITGILHRNGIATLAASDFMRFPRFTDLCARLEDSGEGTLAEQVAPVVAGQNVPLLPFQQDFLTAHPDHWRAVLMALPVELRPGVSVETVERWLSVLPTHYEALRLAFRQDHATMLAEPRPLSLHRRVFDSGTTTIEILRAAVRAVAVEIDPEAGVTLGAFLVERGDTRFLVLVGHHLVLDVVSLDLLCRDFDHFCQGGSAQREVRGVATRAVEVEKLVAHGAFPTREDRSFWEIVCATPTAPLGALSREARDLASERIVRDMRLTGFRSEHSSSVLADLLSALACALHRQGQRQAVFVTLESHGRDDLLPDCDVGRSLGWFTAVCPMPLGPASSCAEARVTVLPWIRDRFTARIANAYGYLRREDPRRFGFDSQIAVNYLGTLASGTEGNDLLNSAGPGAIPELLPPNFEPSSPLDLTSFFDESGVLRVQAYFHPEILPEAWVSSLLENWRAVLMTLPAYVPEETETAIRTACGSTANEIERITLPELNQKGMLYQALRPSVGVYTQQVAFTFHGDVDEFLLMRAWRQVVARHESLRAVFPMPCPGEFFRVVLRQGRGGIAYHDLSHLPGAVVSAEIAALLRTERDRGFDLQKGPLLRMQIFRPDAETVIVSWCFHHLLMDGWCMGILLQEMFALAERLAGHPAPELPAPFALADYVRWRARFDEAAARTYWGSLLDGFTGPTRVAEAGHPAGDGEPETVEMTLDGTLSEGLRAAAAARSVTLPVLIQALWALVLSGENRMCRDVVFGIVTSGRPAELSGIDRAVGLFVQTVPLRARWGADSSFANLLASLKEQSLQQMCHGYLPLAETARDMLDHLIVFETYPFSTRFNSGKVALREVSGFEKIPYPLGISVIPEESLGVRFLFDPAQLPRDRVLALQSRLLAALKTATEAESCHSIEAAIAAAFAAASGVGEVDGAAQADAESLVGEGSTTPNPQRSVPGDDDILGVVIAAYESVLGRVVPSADADFFHLGGHSLLAMGVLARLRKDLSVAVGIDDIMANPSPRQLAARIRDISAPVVAIPRIVPRERHPLSPAQRRLWFLQRLHEDARSYVIPFAATLPGTIDRDRLQCALELVERRHDALRLRVAADRPEQTLAPPGGLRLDWHDEPWNGEALPEMPFGIDRPLVRVALFRQSADALVLLLSFHHIIFDGWSAAIFTRELNEAYGALLQRSEPAWPPLDLDYLSYAEQSAEREYPEIETIREALLPLPERLRLPLDFPRPATRTSAGGVVVVDFGPERSLALKRYAREAGVTPFPVIVALVDAFLYRHTGQTDLIVGCPAANRDLAQTQAMIGLFVNTLVIRARLEPDAGFAALLQTVNRAFQQSLAAQACPFEAVVDAVGEERNAARNPLFDVFIALEDASWGDFGRAPLCMQPISLPHEVSKFDLSIYFRENAEGGYAIHLEYATDLFRQDTVQAMADRLAVLADAVFHSDAVPVAELDILPVPERLRLEVFNQTDVPFDVERDIDSLFRAQARRTPEAAAVVDPSGAVCTYAGFDRQVTALAGWLAERGIVSGGYVGVCYPRSLDMMVCVFAVQRLGAVYVPLSAALPETRLDAICDDLGPAVVLCAPADAPRFARSGWRVLSPDVVDSQSSPPETEIVVPVAPDSISYVIFTSGSTGRPKGVAIEHRSLCNRLLWMQSRFPIGQGDVVLQKTTTSFDVSVWEVFWWSWCGASLALLEPGAEMDPGKIVETVRSRGVTVLHFVPSMLRAFLDHLAVCPEDIGKLGSLRFVFASGEALPRELVERFNTVLDAELHNLYGPTEATIDVSWQPCRPTPETVVPIGRPIANTRLYILDVRLRPVPVGVTGEIYIGGIQVARGYLNRPDLTARSFLPDPFHAEGRIYRTGDLGRWLCDGSIEYLGRNDDQVKIRGFRIELGEVEAALGRCPGVAQAVVRVCRIGGYDALEAFLLPRRDEGLSLPEIRRVIAGAVPDYMCPSLFFEADDIPLSPSGKADRKALRGRPLRLVAESTGDGVTQAAVREIWRQVMPEVEAPDDQGFFEAGGNSLLLVRLHALLDARWPGAFSLASLFSDSTIAAQVRRIEQRQSVGAAVPAPVVAADAPVAIIGMAVRFGDHEDYDRFWADLGRGADITVPMPGNRRRETRQVFEAVGLAYDDARVREAAYLSDVSSFDYRRFGLSPSDASLLDPRQRIFIEAALRALDDAGYGGEALANQAVGTFVGASPCRLFQDAVTRAFPAQSERIYLLNVPSNVVARISYLKNWQGPAATIDTACSSVLAAVHQACRSLRSGESCVALAGGAHVIDLPVQGDRAFTIESTSGQTRTFDARADGVGAGEGAAVFVLKLLEQAQRDNDPIHAVILGSAVNQDGKSSSMAAPNPDAQAAVIRQAARDAAIALADLDLFEAHGTATVLGDPVEIEAISRAFEADGPALERKVPIGSVKGNLGHLDAAAGAAGLAKAVLCLKQGQVPPQPHFETPNPHIDFARAPVRVARTLETLLPERRPWRCGVSSFGLSGVNVHVILSGSAGRTLPTDEGGWICVPLSAPDVATLAAYAEAVRDAVAAHPDWPLHAIAATLTVGRDDLLVRGAVVVRSRQELLEHLGQGLVPAVCARRLDDSVPSGVFAAREAAEDAARAFCLGHSLHWPEDRPLYRVHLPATPFVRTPLWPRFPARFLSAPTETPRGTAVSIAINRADFWPVADHRLLEVPTLVGMALPDLIAQALGPVPLTIENLRWRKPVTAGEGSRAVLMTEAEEQSGIAVEVHHCRDTEWSVAASAIVRRGAAPASPLDIAALQGAMAAFTGGGDASVIRVGGRWQCREAMWAAEDGNRLLAFLSLPDAYRDDLTVFGWHPAMIDVATSLALHGVSGFVPAACGAIRLHKPLPSQVYALVTVTDRQAGMILADCTVTDSRGQVLIELAGLMFLAVRPERAERAEPDLYTVGWEATVLPDQPPATPADILLLGGGGSGWAEALAGLAATHRPLPGRDDERRSLAEEIVRGTVAHLLYLPDTDDTHWAFCSFLQDLCRAGLRRPIHVAAVGCGAFLDGDPARALLLGPLLCLRREEPLIACSYIE
ncbi:non-ribosomal peptide synthetase, partial [Magnetospirillum fulvum MGU-K5]